jgi:hypothetical protein
MMHDLAEGVLTCFAEASRTGRRYRSIRYAFEGDLSLAPYQRRERDVTPEEIPALLEVARRELARDAAERAERRPVLPEAEKRRRRNRRWRAYYRKNRARMLAYAHAHKPVYQARVDAEIRARRVPPSPIVPLAPTEVSPCACGGRIELRPGCTRPIHVGRCHTRVA